MKSTRAVHCLSMYCMNEKTPMTAREHLFAVKNGFIWYVIMVNNFFVSEEQNWAKRCVGLHLLFVAFESAHQSSRIFRIFNFLFAKHVWNFFWYPVHEKVKTNIEHEQNAHHQSHSNLSKEPIRLSLKGLQELQETTHAKNKKVDTSTKWKLLFPFHIMPFKKVLRGVLLQIWREFFEKYFFFYFIIQEEIEIE